MSWTDDRVEILKKMWGEGQSASQIAKELGGVTRNAVIGKVHRLGLSNRHNCRRSRQGRTKAKARRAKGQGSPKAKPEPQPTRVLQARSKDRTCDCAKRTVPAAQPDHSRRPTPATAAFRQRDQPRGPGQGQRDREEGQKAELDGIDRADLQMACW